MVRPTITLASHLESDLPHAVDQGRYDEDLAWQDPIEAGTLTVCKVVNWVFLEQLSKVIRGDLPIHSKERNLTACLNPGTLSAGAAANTTEGRWSIESSSPMYHRMHCNASAKINTCNDRRCRLVVRQNSLSLVK